MNTDDTPLTAADAATRAAARAAAHRLAPRLGRQLVPAVERALAGCPLPDAALDQIAGWLIDAARAASDDTGDPATRAERLTARLDPPRGASPAIARAMLDTVLASALDPHAAAPADPHPDGAHAA